MLRVERLRRRVGSFRLSIDEWQTGRGQYVVVVGPSGAGKTMLLELIAGLHAPDEGRIWLDDEEVTRWPPERRGIGFVYQDYWLFPHLTVRQNIDFGRRYHRDASGQGLPTDDLAEMLHIAHLLDRKPFGLSGGERQRVALARALAIRPRVLFLDEPLGTLDPVTRERVAAELMNCHRAFGMTTLHVTHDHAEARMMGDAVAVILNGRLQQAGPAEEVFRRPETAGLARFLGSENIFEAQSKTDGRDGFVHVRLGEKVLEVRSLLTGTVGLCIRPEFVFVEAQPAAGRGAGDGLVALGRGTVVEAGQRGPTLRVVAEVDGRRWVSVVSRADDHRQRFTPGAAVSLSAPADAIHLIPLENGP